MPKKIYKLSMMLFLLWGLSSCYTDRGKTLSQALEEISRERTLDSIVQDFRSEDPNVRASARAEFENYHPGLEGQILLLNEATKAFPAEEEDEWRSTSSLVIGEAIWRQDVQLIPFIIGNFPKYDERIRWKLLDYLSGFKEKEAIQAYKELLITYSAEIKSFPTGNLEKNFAHKDVLFPDMLGLIAQEPLQSTVLLLFLEHLKARQLDPGAYLYITDTLLKISRKHRRLIRQRQALKSDLWEDMDYQTALYEAGIIADVLGYFKKEKEVVEELKEYLKLKNHRIKMFSVISLLKLQEEVDRKWIADIAADAESRKPLYEKLKSINKESLFPPAYKTQQAFAESDMVNWLIFPTELGRAPDAIELMKVVEYDTKSEEGIIEFYLFRFKCEKDPWKEDGWMAGVSGYYLKKEKPTTQSRGHTFSNFTPWDSKSPDQHVEELMEAVSNSLSY